MTTLQTIARYIAARGRAMGWKAGSKTANKLNMECWVGAYTALVTTDHKDASHIGTFIATVISVRGYRETLHIAEKAENDGPAA